MNNLTGTLFEADREVVGPIVADLLTNKIASLDFTDPFAANYFRAYRSRLLDGLPARLVQKNRHASEALAAFLRRYGFSSVKETPLMPGWTILHYAAMEGRCDLAREIVSKHSVSVTTRFGARRWRR